MEGLEEIRSSIEARPVSLNDEWYVRAVRIG